MTRWLEPGLLPFLLLLAILPFPGTVALRLLCLAAAFVYAIYMWKRVAVPPIPFKPALVVWALVALASLAYAVDPAYSLSEIKNELLYTMMIFTAFFVLASDERRMKAMLLALAAGVLVLCVWALAARFTQGGWNVSGGHGGVGSFAAYLVAVVPVITLLGFYFEDRRLRWLAFVLLGLLLVTGFFSLQRIIWPVLFLQFSVGLFIFRKALGFSLPRVVFVVVMSLLLATTGLIISQVNRYNENPVPGLVMENDTRLVFWPKVAERVLERPLIGAGFGRAAMNKAHADLIPRTNTLFWHGHNVVLNYGLAMGIPGMLALLVVFGALLREYGRFARLGDRPLRMIGVCGIALTLGVFSRNMVDDFFVRDQALLFWALNGILLGIGSRQYRQLRRLDVK